MMIMTTVPGALLFGSHFIFRYWQVSGIYVCGVSRGFRIEDWNTPGRAGGVRMGVGVGGIGVGVLVGVAVGGRGVNVAVGTGVSVAFGAKLPHPVSKITPI